MCASERNVIIPTPPTQPCPCVNVCKNSEFHRVITDAGSINYHIKNIQNIPNAGWIGGFLLAVLPSWQPASSQADVGEPNLRPGAEPWNPPNRGRFGVLENSNKTSLDIGSYLVVGCCSPKLDLFRPHFSKFGRSYYQCHMFVGHLPPFCVRGTVPTTSTSFWDFPTFHPRFFGGNPPNKISGVYCECTVYHSLISKNIVGIAMHIILNVYIYIYMTPDYL